MAKVLDRPFCRSYWVVHGLLLAGNYPGDHDPRIAEAKLSALLCCGIRCTISLMNENEVDHKGLRFTPYDRDLQRLGAARGFEVQCFRIPIPDVSVPDPHTMRAILDTIDAAIAHERPVYVHCWGGVGRTGTVVGCWLARHRIAVGQAAIHAIRAMRVVDAKGWKTSPETHKQREFVRRWPVGG